MKKKNQRDIPISFCFALILRSVERREREGGDLKWRRRWKARAAAQAAATVESSSGGTSNSDGGATGREERKRK